MSGLKPNKKIMESAAAIPFQSLHIFGAEDEGGAAGGEQGNGEQGGEPQKKQGEASGEGGDGGEDKTDFSGITDEKDRRIAELSDESARKRITIRELKAEIDGLKKDVDKANRRGTKDEISEEARTKIEGPLQEKIDKVTKGSLKVALENAILRESIKDGADRRIWFDPSDVFSNIDLDSIEFDPESGTIEGIAEELNRIATAKPHLVKEKGKAKKKADDDDEGRRKGASGRQPGGAGSQRHGMEKSRRQELGQKYPILNRR